MFKNGFTLSFLKHIILLMTVVLLAACVSSTNTVVKKDKEIKEGVLPLRLTIGVTCKKSLDTARQWIESYSLSTAEKVLLGAYNNDCVSGYEKVQLQRLMAYVMSAQKKYAAAIDAYQYVVDSKYLDLLTRSEAVYTLAQIRFLTEDYEAVIDGINQGVADEMLLNAEADLLLARSYYRLNRYSEGLAIMEQIVAEKEQRGGKVKESWLALLWSLYYDSHDYQQAMSVSGKLMAHYPKDKYRQKRSHICDVTNMPQLCELK